MSQYDKPKRLEKLSKKEILDLTFDLINAFRLVKTPLDTALLLQDLLTAREIRNISRRLRIAKMLLSGKTQEEITRDLHCSYATVTKVSVWLNQGGGGLKQTIAKLPKKYKMPQMKRRGPIEYHLPQTLYDLYKYSQARAQQKKIESLDKFLENLKSKKVLDKALQEMFDEEFRRNASDRKKSEFKKKIKTK